MNSGLIWVLMQIQYEKLERRNCGGKFEFQVLFKLTHFDDPNKYTSEKKNWIQTAVG